MRYEFRPLDWTGPSTPWGQHKAGQFRASHDATIELLFTEAEKLGAEHIVVQVDIPERYIRADGMPWANARYGSNPGVVVSFASRHGPLRYATDTYGDWRDNLRAIALSLEALRAVDRYGVSKRGEQYTGWKALPAGNGSGFSSADAALRWMRGQDELEGGNLTPGALYRKLARRMHPDTPTGNPAEWDQLDAAKVLLTAAGML